MSNRPTNGNPGSERAYVMKGDATSHDGVVMEGNKNDTWHGLESATKGHKVFCPKCKPHIFIISEGVSTNTSVNGQPRALEGHLTSCGAILYTHAASRNSTLCAQAILNVDTYKFDEQIKAVDENGTPLSGISYFIERADGVTFVGETDGLGHCPRIASQTAQELKVWFGLAAHQKSMGVIT